MTSQLGLDNHELCRWLANIERTCHAVDIRCVSYSENGGSLVHLPWQRRGGGGKERAFKASSLTCDTTVHLR